MLLFFALVVANDDEDNMSLVILTNSYLVHLLQNLLGH